MPCAPPPASLVLSILSGLAATGSTLSFYIFSSFRPSLPRFPLGASTTTLRFLALLRRLSSALPDPVLVPVPVILVCLFVCVCLKKNLNASRPSEHPVLLCVVIPFIILDVRLGGRTSRGYTGGRSHRISHPPSFCGACCNLLSREGFSRPFFPLSTVKGILYIEFGVPPTK